MPQDIVAYFAINGVPALNLSPTIRIRELLSGSPNSVLVVAGDAMSAIGDGYYKFIFVSFDPRKEYVFRANGGASVPSTDRFAIGATESPQPEETADAVWNAEAADHPVGSPVGSPITMGAQLNLTAEKSCNILTFTETLIKFQANRTVLDKTAFTLTIYDNDKVTPIRVFDLRQLGVGPSITEITERLPASGSPLTL